MANRVIFVTTLDKNASAFEGGTSRAVAWMNYLKSHNSNLKVLSLPKNFLKFPIHFLFLLTSFGNTIFYFHASYGLNLFSNNILKRFLADFFILMLKFASKHNTLVFDINDLKYEQAIDLELDYPDYEIINRREKIFFSVQGKYIFASESMREYAIKKYSLVPDDTSLCLNGATTYQLNENKFNNLIDRDVINYVYSGTLNKGRSIEKMIDAFPSSNEYHLYLLGPGGEWITEYSVKKNNIHYLGSYSEEAAYNIVSQCDVGIIPYDDSRFYYNIAYPTKLPFYLVCGLTYLSTPVDEVKTVHNKYQVGHIAKIQDWSSTIQSITKEQIIEEQKTIEQIKTNFTWDQTLSHNVFLD